MSDPNKEGLFDSDEVVGDIEEIPDLDGKLDTIIDLLKKNEREHQEIRDELKEIKQDQKLLRAAYQEHGKALGDIMSRLNGFGGSHP